MELGDCGSIPNLQLSTIFDANSEQLSNKHENNETEGKSGLRKDKVPRRILHFSDGTIEEYSSDDDEPDTSGQLTAEVHPSTLSWGPWIKHHTVHIGNKSLQVCDYLGEYLAGLLGITTPKYQYEIDEYNRTVAEEEERQRKKDLEMGGWTGTPAESGDTVQTAPTPKSDTTHLTAERDSNVDENRF